MNTLWNITPHTVEQAVTSLIAVRFYETIYGEPAPVEQAIVLTNELMTDVLQRIVRIEAELGI